MKIKINYIIVLAVIATALVFATSCEKKITDSDINNEKSTIINHYKYEKMGRIHNECLDVIKNDKDFKSILKDDNLELIFQRNFGEIKYINSNLVIESYINDIPSYAEYMIQNGKITEKEYKFCLFVEGCGNDYNSYSDVETIKETIKKDVKNYIDKICKEKDITQKELDYILGGSYVFLYSLDYWFGELQNDNSKWVKLISSANQSKYISYSNMLEAMLASAKADAVAKSECMSDAGDEHGSYYPSELWDEIYAECGNVAGKASAKAFIKVMLYF